MHARRYTKVAVVDGEYAMLKRKEMLLESRMKRRPKATARRYPTQATVRRNTARQWIMRTANGAATMSICDICCGKLKEKYVETKAAPRMPAHARK